MQVCCSGSAVKDRNKRIHFHSLIQSRPDYSIVFVFEKNCLFISRKFLLL